MNTIQLGLPSSYGDSNESEPIPAGWYECAIVKSELALPKSSPEAGRMLSLALRVEDHPEHTGRQVFQRLCFEHAKETPRNIALRQLSQIIHSIPRLAAAMAFDTDNPSDLVGERLMVRVKVAPPKDGYGPRNEVTAYGAIGSVVPSAPSVKDAAAEAAATTAPRPATTTAAPGITGIAAGTKPAAPIATGMKARPAWGK
jgi:hypothetical protein